MDAGPNLNAARSAEPQGAARAESIFLRGAKIVAALLVLPLCVGMTLGVTSGFSAAARGGTFFPKWFGWGALAFAILATLMWRPVTQHVFGNKLLKFTERWFRLAPYCVPVFALGVVISYALLNAHWRPLAGHFQWVAFALGFFYAFHVAFALWNLRSEFFSLVTIYFVNLGFAMLFAGFLQHGEMTQSWPALRDCSVVGWKRSVAIYKDISVGAKWVLERNVATPAETRE